MKIYVGCPLTALQAWDMVWNEGVIVTLNETTWNFPQYQRGLGGVDEVWPEDCSETYTKEMWEKEFAGETFYVTENEKASVKP